LNKKSILKRNFNGINLFLFFLNKLEPMLLKISNNFFISQHLKMIGLIEDGVKTLYFRRVFVKTNFFNRKFLRTVLKH